MPHTYKLFSLISAIGMLSVPIHAAKREEVDRVVGRVNGINITKSQLSTPQIINNCKPFTFDQYAANLLWLQQAREQHIEPPLDDVTRSVNRYKQDNGLAGLSDDEADRLLKGQIGIDFATYRAQLADYYTIETLKSYEFRNRCSVAECEVRGYYDENPVLEQAEYRIDLVNLTPEQLVEWESGVLPLSGLDWDNFAFLKHDQVASHLQVIYTMTPGSCELVVDPQGEPLLIRLVEKKDSRVQSLTERYHTIEMALQREKIAKHAAESEQKTAKNAVIVML